MSRKVSIAVVALLGGLLVLLSVGYVFREPLLVAGLNALLPREQLSISSVQGVRLGAERVEVDAVELLLPGSGQRLALTDFALTYRRSSFFALPTVETVVIASAQLRPDEGLAPPATVATERGTGASVTPTVTDLLRLLRNFPLTSVQLTALSLPQWPDPVALGLESSSGTVRLALNSGALRVDGTFTQQDAAARAQLELVVRNGDQTPGEVTLALEPVADAWRVSGSGVLALAPETLPALVQSSLALKAIDVAWRLEGELADAPDLSAPAAFTLVVDAGSSVSLPSGLVPGLGELTLALGAGAQFTVLTGADQRISVGSLPLELAGRWHEQPFAASLALSIPTCSFANYTACSIGFAGNATLDALAVAADSSAADAAMLTGLAVTGSGNLGMYASTLLVTLEPGAMLTAAEFGSGSVHATGLALGNASVLKLGSALNEARYFLEGGEVNGSLGTLSLGQYNISTGFELRDLSLSQAPDLSAALTLQTQELTITGPQRWLPAVDIAASIVLDRNQLSFSTPVLPRGAAAASGLRIEGKHDLASGAGDARITLPQVTFAGESSGLASYLSGWPYDFDLVKGSLAADLQLQWQPAATAASTDASATTRITGNVKAALTDIAGYYADYFFRGLNTSIDASLDFTAALPLDTPAQELTMSGLDVGLPVSNIVMRYQFDRAAQTLTVAALHAELLDGTISAEDLRYDFGGARNTLTIAFAGLRLERLLELTAYEGVQASGAVSGEVPIVFTEQGVEVAAGRLFAEQPGGTIKYLGAVGDGQGNAALDMMNQALGNYQFESLESSIDYSPDGELVLGMKLQGHNPDMNNGQRINLNLNLSDNIPALLKSLQAGRAIEDFLQQQYE